MRPVAFCLLENNGRLLLQEFWHEHDNYHFYRPPGGGIEQGERALEAMRRELREELDTEISEPQFLTVVENIFDYGGETKHEIVFLFRASILDEKVINAPEMTLTDTYSYRAVWLSLESLSRGDVILYPVEVRERLAEFFPEYLAMRV